MGLSWPAFLPAAALAASLPDGHLQTVNTAVVAKLDGKPKPEAVKTYVQAVGAIRWAYKGLPAFVAQLTSWPRHCTLLCSQGKQPGGPLYCLASCQRTVATLWSVLWPVTSGMLCILYKGISA